MTEKLIQLIESELPELIDDNFSVFHFKNRTLEEQEVAIETELHRFYPNENQLEQRNNFRIKWNKIIEEHGE